MKIESLYLGMQLIKKMMSSQKMQFRMRKTLTRKIYLRIRMFPQKQLTKKEIFTQNKHPMECLNKNRSLEITTHYNLTWMVGMENGMLRAVMIICVQMRKEIKECNPKVSLKKYMSQESTKMPFFIISGEALVIERNETVIIMLLQVAMSSLMTVKMIRIPSMTELSYRIMFLAHINGINTRNYKKNMKGN